jgi:putative tricarboxylic transport membrane protein
MRLDSAFADRATALVLFLLGAATAYGGFVMDRLEVRRIHPASIPGLVPMMLGVALMVCALALAWSARAPRETDPPESVSWSNLLVAIVWSGLYALAAVGTLPFGLATGIYIAGFTLWFLWTDAGGRPGVPTALAVVAFSAVTAAGIAALFRYGFLVRLP